MRRTRHSSHIRPGRARRHQVWARSNTTITLPDGYVSGSAPQALDLLTTFKAASSLGATPGYTVDRIRGLLTVNYVGTVSATLADASLQLIVSARIYDGPVAAGLPATDGPVDAPYSNWMWYQFFPVVTAPGALVSTTDQAGSAHIIDVRSKRKFEELNDTLVMFIDTAAGSAALPPAIGLTGHVNLSISLLEP